MTEFLADLAERSCHLVDDLVAIYEAQGGRCAFSGIKLAGSGPYEAEVGLNDSGEVQLVCRWVNQARGNLSVSEFRGVLGAVVEAEHYRMKVVGDVEIVDHKVYGLFPHVVISLSDAGNTPIGDLRRLIASGGSEIEVYSGSLSVLQIFLKEVLEWVVDRFWLESLVVTFGLDAVKVAIREWHGGTGDLHNEPFLVVGGVFGVVDRVEVWCYGSGVMLSCFLCDPEIFSKVKDAAEHKIVAELKKRAKNGSVGK